VALAYVGLLVALPVGLIVWRTLEHGLGALWHNLTSANACHALKVTAEVAVLAVIANTIFGVGAAVLLVRHKFPGRRVMDAFIDLPLAVSPVVVGLALVLVYGKTTGFGGWLADHGVKIIFAVPGMVLATIFVSLPLVVREIAPVLEEIGVEQEQAAWTLGASTRQAFRRVTIPAIRWALAYGVVLTLARAMGEYGAVAVVSGRLVGKTQTATLFVEERYQNFDQPAAYAMAFALAAIAVVILLAITALRPEDHR
jgi:sulfate transport system permease protein